jgi:hypothetical protein
MNRSVVAAVAASALIVSAAGAATPPRSKVVLGGRGFRTNVTAAFAAPASYSVKTLLRYGGTWKGPRSQSSTTGDEADSLLDFSAHSDFTTRSAAVAARGELGNDPGWPVVTSGPVAVPHVIGGRKVGAVTGFMLIRRKAGQGYEGWYRAALGFPLGKGYPVLVADFGAETPGDDSAETIEGQLPSAWNRTAIEQAIAGVVLDGNLAAQAVAAAVKGRRIAGRVTDTLGHPVVGVKVTVRGRGGVCCSGATTGAGTFALSVPKSAGAGAFVVSVSGAGATLTKSVTVR